MVLDHFHSVQHLSRAMNQFDKQSKEYRRLKRYWKIIQTDSRKLSTKRTYQPMFQMHLTSQEILDELLGYSEKLNQHYQLYQILLFHIKIRFVMLWSCLIPMRDSRPPIISSRLSSGMPLDSGTLTILRNVFSSP